MQTFLTHYTFTETAAALDNKRLFKQAVETKQIILANQRYANELAINPTREPSVAWKNHPAVKMWRGHEGALALYGYMIALECMRRNYKAERLADYFSVLLDYGPVVYPEWMQDETTFKRVRDTHRSALVKKLPEHYRSLFPNALPFTAYYWPV